MTTTIKTKNIATTKREFTNWLNTAIHFSVWFISDKKHVEVARDFIFDDIGEKYRLSKNKNYDRAMLMSIMLNLWVGFCTGCPVQISLNKNKYSRNAVKTAYGKVFFSYGRTKRLLKELEIRGYMQHKIGHCNYDKEDTGIEPRETRIWGTEKLLRLFLVDYKFQLFDDIYQDQDTKPIQLNEKIIKKVWDKKNKKWKETEIKVPVPFDDTEATLKMKKKLEKYNQLAAEETITVKILENTLIKPKVLTEAILYGLNSGAIKLVKSELNFEKTIENQNSSDRSESVTQYSYMKHQESVLQQFSSIPGLQIIQYTHKKNSYSTITMNDVPIELINLDKALSRITNTVHSQHWQDIEPNQALFLFILWQKKMFDMIKVPGRNDKDRRRKKNILMNKTRPLIDFGIKYLEFEINKKYLHRVFNEGSKNFDKGGRFFGAFYHQLHEEIRDCIHINGNETGEIDFSGMHIRMLYHQNKINYTKDPYKIGRKNERTKYKFVSLISINADRKKASGGIYKKLNDEGIKYHKGKGSIKKMMDAFKDYHNPIRDDLFKAKGVGLQNIDSHIMEKILMRLHGLGICGLPVHDSVIVEKGHYNLLYTIMMEEYEKVMGCEPVLK